MSLRRLTRIAVLSALAALLMLIQLPYPFAPFLKYEPSGVAVLTAAFSMGPWAGIGVAALKNLLYLMLKSSPSSLIGVPMNFLALSAFAGVAGLIYARKHNIQGAVLALFCGSLAMSLLMVPLNLLVYPWFEKLILPGVVPLNKASLLKLVLTAVLPFNLIQGLLDSLLTFLLYKKVSYFFRKNTLAKT